MGNARREEQKDSGKDVYWHRPLQLSALPLITFMTEDPLRLSALWAGAKLANCIVRGKTPAISWRITFGRERFALVASSRRLWQLEVLMTASKRDKRKGRI